MYRKGLLQIHEVCFGLHACPTARVLLVTPCSFATVQECQGCSKFADLAQHASMHLP